MNRGMKRFFIICAIAVGAGLILAVAGFAAGGLQSIDKLAAKYDWIHGSPGKTQYLQLDEDEKFQAVRIEGAMDVRICSDNKSMVRIAYGENEETPELYVEDGVLKAIAGDEFDGAVINLSGKSSTPVLEIYCERDQLLKEIDVQIDYGDVEMEGISLGSIRINADYGDVSFDQVEFDSADIEAACGDIDGFDVISGGLRVKAAYGSCDLAGTLQGVTDISMDNGDVILETSLAESRYTIEAQGASGDMSIGDQSWEGYENHCSYGSGPNTIRIRSDYGDVDVSFSE